MIRLSAKNLVGLWAAALLGCGFQATAAKLKWVDETPVIHQLISRAETALKRRKFRAAFRYFRKIEKKSRRRQNRAAALLGQGRSLRGRRSYYQACLKFKRAVDNYANCFPREEALHPEFLIAINHLEGKRKWSWYRFREDNSKALKVYAHIVSAGPDTKLAPLALYRTGMILRAGKKNRQAATKFALFLDRYPGHELDRETRQNLTEVLLKKAWNFRLRGKHSRAYKEFKFAVDNYPGYIPLEQVLSAEYQIALDHLEFKRTWLGFSKTPLAIRIYAHVNKRGPYTKTGPPALYRQGKLLLESRKDYEGAAEKLELFLTRHPRHELSGDARLDLVKALLENAEDFDGDAGLVRRARYELARFKRLHPGHQRQVEAAQLLARARNCEAKRLLSLGRFYRRRGAHYRPHAARRYLQELLEKYGDTLAAPQARKLLARLPKNSKAMAEPGTGMEKEE